MTTADRVDLGSFTFECGESIPNLRVAYETAGEYDGDNAVLVCHALTGSANVAGSDGADQASGWWDDIVGPGKAIDTTEYFVVCANVPGSCYGSSGPASTAPDGDLYGVHFPPVTVTDWVRAQRQLLDHLGVESLHAVVGGSVGGMNALEWAKQYPEHVDRVVPVATAARLDAQCLALDAIARRAIVTDPNWNGGDYYDGPHPDHGLALARQIGHVMYLSKHSMSERFGRNHARRSRAPLTPDDPAVSEFAYRDVESYLDYQGESFVDRFDANSYLYLTRAMDDYDLAAGYGSDRAALAGFDGDVLVMSFTGDWHFTVDQAASVARAFRTAGASTAHHVVDSEYGHDAFLVELDRVGPPLASFLSDGVDGHAVSDAAETPACSPASARPGSD